MKLKVTEHAWMYLPSPDLSDDKKENNMDIETSAAALYDGGWRAEDKDELKAEYDLTEEEATAICNKLAEWSE